VKLVPTDQGVSDLPVKIGFNNFLTNRATNKQIMVIMNRSNRNKSQIIIKVLEIKHAVLVD
jgi:hypothetical protein